MAQTFRVILLPKALHDLREIARYIRRQSPQNAALVVERIVDMIDSLASMPQRYKQVGKSRKLGSSVHAVVVRPFIIYYRIDAEVVHVLNVRRGPGGSPSVSTRLMELSLIFHPAAIAIGGGAGSIRRSSFEFVRPAVSAASNASLFAAL
jgi:plasmid stabilization system protein ParE